MKILPVKINFAPVLNKPVNNNLLFANLSPLKKDTVSFSQRKTYQKPVNVINFDKVIDEDITPEKTARAKACIEEDLKWSLLRYNDRIERFYNLLRQYKDPSVDIPNIDLMQNYHKVKYDLPERFAIVANNTMKNNGKRAIVANLPEMFAGLDIDEVSKKLDMLRLFLDEESENAFTIGDKKFKANYVAEGHWGKVYKLEDESGNNAALKIFNKHDRIGIYGSYGEIAIALEMAKHNIIDIPVFYMGNPTSRNVYMEDSKESAKIGAWMLSEFVTEQTPLKSGKLKFADWCEKMGLRNVDLKEENYVGKYTVDHGGMDNLETIRDDYFYMDLSWYTDSYPYIQDNECYIGIINDLFDVNDL